jgi:hypothetical protein
MQHEPACQLSAVDAIADNGMADLAQMNAQLVHPAGARQ